MIYIVRHGQTDWNIKELYQGASNIELNEFGRSQALELKKLLSGIKFDEVISSPLIRAYETATIITGNKNIKIDSRLIERIGGNLEGKPLKEAFDMVDFNDPDEHRYNVENVVDFKKRIASFVDEIKKNNQGKNLLIVTHAGVCVYIRCCFEGEPEDKDYLKYKIGNCEIIKYEN